MRINSKLMDLSQASVGDEVRLGLPLHVDETILRLWEMGMTPGVLVTVVRRAPFGDPMELWVRGTRLCLRRSDAVRFPTEWPYGDAVPP